MLYIVSIVGTCVSKNQKEVFAMWVWLGRKSWKRVEAYIRHVNLLYKKDFKIAELLAKASFFLYFRERPENGEGNTHQKTWRKLNLIWIDYGLIWLYIYIQEQFSLLDTNTSTLTSFMISLFLAAPAPRVQRVWNLTGTSMRNGRRFFLLFRKKHYFIQMLSFLIINLFRNVLQTSE